MEPSEDHVKIDSLKLTINGLTVELKIDQARRLWSQLDEIFGPKPAVPIWIETPAYPPQVPWYINSPTVLCNPNTDPFPERWSVSCDAYAGNSLNIVVP